RRLQADAGTIDRPSSPAGGGVEGEPSIRFAHRRRIRGREGRGALRDACGTAQPGARPPSLSGDHSMSITAERKAELIRTHARSEADTGSAEVQVAILSERIANLTEHFKTHKKDNHSRRGLLMLVSQRRSLLGHLKKSDEGRYQTIIKALGIRDTVGQRSAVGRK